MGVGGGIENLVTKGEKTMQRKVEPKVQVMMVRDAKGKLLAFMDQTEDKVKIIETLLNSEEKRKKLRETAEKEVIIKVTINKDGSRNVCEEVQTPKPLPSTLKYKVKFTQNGLTATVYKIE